eukprot:6256361-Lingulodinium_polyedra.AAC.1
MSPFGGAWPAPAWRESPGRAGSSGATRPQRTPALGGTATLKRRRPQGMCAEPWWPLTPRPMS